ncbi:MAG TPA: recombinase zinc beta ribbon domain-containing protein, partial [Ignavibacteriaceae bacterium]
LTGNFTITGLAGLMNQWGFKTRTNKPIGKQLLEKLLKEKFYAGILFDPWTNKEYKGLHTPMISVEEYNHIQEIKSGFSRHTDRPRQLFHPELPLRRFVSCECGSKLTGSLHRGSNSDKKYPIYHCHNRDCQHFGHTIRKEDLEKVFVDLLYRITPKTELLNLFEAVVVSSWESQHVAVKQERKHYDQELSKLQTQKDNLLQMRVRGEISKEEFLIMKERIDNTITGIKISSNESQIEELNVEIIIDNAKKLIGNVAEQWKEMNPSQKHRFQKLVLPHGITYNKNSNALGTAVLSPVFKLNDEFAGSSSDLVAWVGQNWQGMIADLKDLSDLYMDKKEQLPL